jgi:putative Mg2+ transporter-C (MgtC) family protein
VAQALNRDDFVLRSLRSKDLDGQGGLVEVTAELQRYGRDDLALEAAVSRLSLEPTVSSVSWNAREPAVLAAAGE